MSFCTFLFHTFSKWEIFFHLLSDFSALYTLKNFKQVRLERGSFKYHFKGQLVLIWSIFADEKQKHLIFQNVSLIIKNETDFSLKSQMPGNEES